jgi:16S rRNA (guanine966-N2)-methyltransferase
MGGNSVRIIGGMWRGRKLTFPDQRELRPTLGRVRETVFNWLRDEVEGSRCLDLFAGSGALGFEAVSRGAAWVTFVDSRRDVVRAIKENAARLDAGPRAVGRRAAGHVEVVLGRAERVLARLSGPYDIVFVDPPFDSNLLESALAGIAAARLVAPGGLVYFEGSKRHEPDLSAWREVRSGRAGETRFGLLATP